MSLAENYQKTNSIIGQIDGRWTPDAMSIRPETCIRSLSFVPRFCKTVVQFECNEVRFVDMRRDAACCMKS